MTAGLSGFPFFPNFAVDGYVSHHADCHKLLRHILSDEVDVLLMGQPPQEWRFLPRASWLLFRVSLLSIWFQRTERSVAQDGSPVELRMARWVTRFLRVKLKNLTRAFASQSSSRPISGGLNCVVTIAASDDFGG